MTLRITKQDRADVNRIWGAAKVAGRYPTDEEIMEVALLKFVREALASGKFTVKALRSQFGGISREQTIRKAAKALTFYSLQSNPVEEDGKLVGMTVPDGMMETFAALRSGRP